jgi:hypothetical protein
MNALSPPDGSGFRPSYADSRIMPPSFDEQVQERVTPV